MPPHGVGSRLSAAAFTYRKRVVQHHQDKLRARLSVVRRTSSTAAHGSRIGNFAGGAPHPRSAPPPAAATVAAAGGWPSESNRRHGCGLKRGRDSRLQGFGNGRSSSRSVEPSLPYGVQSRTMGSGCIGREAFDFSPRIGRRRGLAFWNVLSTTSEGDREQQQQQQQQQPGLAGVQGLREPDDFMRLARGAIEHCEVVMGRIHEYDNPTPSLGIDAAKSLAFLRDLDGISNTICSVIDSAEFIRSVHTDEEWRQCAEDSFTLLAGFIQQLNTDVSIYSALRAVAEAPEVMDGFTEEQRLVATTLKTEMEASGIHLSTEDREQLGSLQGKMTQLETLFNSNLVTKQRHFQVQKAALRGVPEHILAAIPQPAGQSDDVFTLSTASHICSAMLKYVRDGETRRQIYFQLNTVTEDNVPVLEHLLQARHAYALKLGFPSYAHRLLTMRMAENPDSVVSFLRDMASKLERKVRAEVKLLREAKMRYEGSDDLQAWDIPYYMGLTKAMQFELDNRTLSAHFEMDNCVKGLAMVCKELFGIEVEQQELQEGESWCGDAKDAGIRKLVLSHPLEGPLGTIYLDLHPRPGKYTHAAHFTIRCGYAVNAHRPCSKEEGLEYQLPVVALVCNFPSASAPGQGGGGGSSLSLLSHPELETLFHEFGHALHSLLSRTEFQHLSGTRCPVDFVETPSILMEYFAWDFRVLSRFAKHYHTGEPIPEEMINNLRRSKNMFAGIDNANLISFSLLDQYLHGESKDRENSTAATARLHNEILPYPYAEGTFTHSRFGHFTGYSAGYYGYLSCKLLAANIWSRCFEGNPLNSEQGTLLWKGLLRHGAAKDFHSMLDEVLGGKEPSADCLLHEFGVEEEEEGKVAAVAAAAGGGGGGPGAGPTGGPTNAGGVAAALEEQAKGG